MSKLIIVPTPIGNLDDITLRAIKTLQEADLILAEDTRVTAKLLKHLNIQKKLQSYHQHNEHKILDFIIEKLKSGIKIALVSDAGTPSISDPGFLLVRECVKENIEIETLPGPVAFIPALVNSGLPCDRFVFEGFLPQKKGRKKRLEELSQENRTIILYESPYKLLKTLEHIKEYFGEERTTSVSRELTKIYEETVRGSITDVFKYFSEKPIKGEFVLVIEGIK